MAKLYLICDKEKSCHEKKTQPNALLHSNSDTALSTKKYITVQDALKP